MKLSLEFPLTAVKVGDQYIVSGMGSMALNVTHPSPLDDDRLEYHLRLTPDLLPEMEELLLPGPLQQAINIQVMGENHPNLKKKLTVDSCFNS